MVHEVDDFKAIGVATKLMGCESVEVLTTGNAALNTSRRGRAFHFHPGLFPPR